MNRAATYRALAAENLAQAQRAATPQLRRWFLEIANSYARMAARLEQNPLAGTLHTTQPQRPKSR